MKLSIIIPCYNVELYIGDCLSSIKNNVPYELQASLELVIVNDGSKDRTLQIIKEFDWTDSNFNIKVISQDNMGLSSARNIGIAESSGEYVGFLDSDDIWLSSISKVLEYIIKTSDDFDIVEFDAIRFHENIKSGKSGIFNYIKLNKTSHRESYKEIVFSNSVWMVWSRFFKRDIIGGKLFPVGITYEDIIFTSECYLEAETIISFNAICVGYRFNDSSISAKVNNKDKISMEYILEDVFSRYQHEPSIYRYLLLCNTYLFYQSILFALNVQKDLTTYEHCIQSNKYYYKLGLIKKFKINHKVLFSMIKKIFVGVRNAI
ncbi:glycosyltransferase family 2 protein [Buttiauxella ferragutiae]|uniref:glycosyltransferase family 2 protein n=1 Tax=Buttiauxella ferragutiae TaxID=82989 RepID=UPI001F536530|nr:glycosyltransferase family 2 protein [Buttiauxella ferragutiae]UNK62862.1 glycosyltransferase [Buttiauxella ferragutiae]